MLSILSVKDIGILPTNDMNDDLALEGLECAQVISPALIESPYKFPAKTRLKYALTSDYLRHCSTVSGSHFPSPSQQPHSAANCWPLVAASSLVKEVSAR